MIVQPRWFGSWAGQRNNQSTLEPLPSLVDGPSFRLDQLVQFSADRIFGITEGNFEADFLCLFSNFQISTQNFRNFNQKSRKSDPSKPNF